MRAAAESRSFGYAVNAVYAFIFRGESKSAANRPFVPKLSSPEQWQGSMSQANESSTKNSKHPHEVKWEMEQTPQAESTHQYKWGHHPNSRIGSRALKRRYSTWSEVQRLVSESLSIRETACPQEMERHDVRRILRVLAQEAGTTFKPGRINGRRYLAKPQNALGATSQSAGAQLASTESSNNV